MTRKFSYIYKGKKDGFDFEGYDPKNQAKNEKESKKFQAFMMRNDGLPYSHISAKLGISKSTLSYWFAGPGDDETKSKNRTRNIQKSKERILKISTRKREALFADYEKALSEARNDYEKHFNDPLFVAGLMIYAGEGDRASRHSIRITNSDYRIHRVFISFMQKYLYFPSEKRVFHIVSFPGENLEEIEEYWSEKLEIPRKNFFRPQIIHSNGKRKLQFGIGTTIISNTRAKYKLLEWINTFLDQKNNAGMV